MIPQQLTLKNFLSYREATLDFSGLHTACICGPNGAGKSSLLEAIAWAIWGVSRSTSEDDIIHIGETEARVDFIFLTQGQVYRIIRNRRRGQSCGLEFQIATHSSSTQGGASQLNFRSLSERGLRATQEKILEAIKLDYDTFINSAYLRQGRADEFMLKRASDRKEILASLLKLDRYDLLAEQAKDLSRQYKGSVEVLQQSLNSLKEQLQQRNDLTTQQASLQQTLTQLQQQQSADTEHLQQLRTQQHNRHTWEKLLSGEQQQYNHLAQECRRLQQELATAKQQQQELQALLQQESEIAAGFTRLQTLQAAEETCSAKFKAHQEALSQRQLLQEQQRQQLSTLQGKIQQVQAQLDALEQQEREVQDVLRQQPEVEAGLAQLQASRSRLSQLDQLQSQVAPLLQQRQQLQAQIDRICARQSARLEELTAAIQTLRTNQQQRQPQLQQELAEIADRILQLENKRVYQQRVREKGQERHHFLERLQATQRDCEAKLAELEQKIQLLGTPPNSEEAAEASVSLPLCPLCDRPLDGHHWQLVASKHQTQQQEIWNQVWVVREQLAISEREIQVLRTEYRQIEQELAPYEELRERRGSVQAQLSAIAQDAQRWQQLAAEASQIERSLQGGDYAAEQYTELHQLEQQLQQLNYSDQNHALARNEEKRWRWAEIKMGQIKDAQQKLIKINGRRPELQAQFRALQQQLEQQKTQSELQQQILALDRHLREIDYRLEQHEHLRIEVRQNQFWLTRVEKLQAASKQFPQVQARIQELSSFLEVRSRDLEVMVQQIEALRQQLQQTPDPTSDIQILEQKIQQRRQKLDECLSSLGRLQQQQQYLETLQAQQEVQKQQLQATRRQHRVYQELAQAFGRNGIQALMIENVLPQLEAETNQILARLSANQLHIQFVTQRATKASSSSAKKATKFIDTLDILIADARGTRPYETYSGGEAFRINFAIRLALARLLAQRAGTSLQMLIIDEGFGTQDAEGCDRLIAAINAIASDFTCILTVTHIPHLKEAFQARIEVSKTPLGSRISLSI
ncbi:MAG: exonuclease subunit SbcC [Actinomycetota bacterium]